MCALLVAGRTRAYYGFSTWEKSVSMFLLLGAIGGMLFVWFCVFRNAALIRFAQNFRYECAFAEFFVSLFEFDFSISIPEK